MVDREWLSHLDRKAERRHSVFEGENRLVANESMGRWPDSHVRERHGTGWSQPRRERDFPASPRWWRRVEAGGRVANYRCCADGSTFIRLADSAGYGGQSAGDEG